ncbi:MAG: HAD family hydrolase [Victivallaceae bacterium]
MKIKGILLDINGTVADILTDEGCDDVYRMMSNLLDYQGIKLSAGEFRKLFFETAKQQKQDSGQEHPEFDAVGIFSRLLVAHAGEYTRTLPHEKLRMLPQFLAEAYRAATRFKLETYADVKPVLESLRGRYRLAAVSDAQAVWAIPELWSLGLEHCFETVVISSDYGCRKPNPRLFAAALDKLDMRPEDVVFVGNDMYRDVWGAHEAGMKTVFFRSNQGDWRSRGVEADYIIYNFRELPAAVEFLERN